MKTRKLVAITVAATLAVLASAGAIFVYSGVYNIGATAPHPRAEFMLLSLVQQRAVKAHARGETLGPLEEPAMVQRGLLLYRSHCVTCHGAPGEGRSKVGIGVNPNPPRLERAARDWSPAEIHWMISHGLKMAGMPAFELSIDAQGRLDLTAFVLRMHTLTPAQYLQMVDAVEGRGQGTDVIAWVETDDPGWERLAASGDKARGRAALSRHGCGTCHVIPGVPGADGRVGPPLARWSERHYVAGRLLNSPVQLVRWLKDPKQIKRETLMPTLAMSDEEAWDMARFLYALD